MMARKEHIVLEADPADAEDFAVDQVALDRARMGRRVRQLRLRLGLTQDHFARRYGIPVANIRQYEIGRVMPSPAVQSYLKVIEQQPDMAAKALAA